MDLTQHFDQTTANILATAIELHPELARLIHYRVINGRDIPDASMTRYDLNIGLRAVLPPKLTLRITPNATTPEPPKRTTPRKPPSQPPRKPTSYDPRSYEPAQTPVIINRIIHNDTPYVTFAHVEQLVTNTPIPQHTGNRPARFVYESAYPKAGHGHPTIRKLLIGHQDVKNILMYNEHDVHLVIEHRLTRSKTQLPKYADNVTNAISIHHDGHDWIKSTHALAILTGMPIEVLMHAWRDIENEGDRKMDTLNMRFRREHQVRRQIPRIAIGHQRHAVLYRLADIQPFANTIKGIE